MPIRTRKSRKNSKRRSSNRRSLRMTGGGCIFGKPSVDGTVCEKPDVLTEKSVGDAIHVLEEKLRAKVAELKALPASSAVRNDLLRSINLMLTLKKSLLEAQKTVELYKARVGQRGGGCAFSAPKADCDDEPVLDIENFDVNKFLEPIRVDLARRQAELDEETRVVKEQYEKIQALLKGPEMLDDEELMKELHKL